MSETARERAVGLITLAHVRVLEQNGLDIIDHDHWEHLWAIAGEVWHSTNETAERLRQLGFEVRYGP